MAIWWLYHILIHAIKCLKKGLYWNKIVCPKCPSVDGYNPVTALTGAILLNFNFKSVDLTQNVVEIYNR